MKTSLNRRRLDRIERQRSALLSLEPIAGIGLSALLALSPDPVPDSRDMATQDELRWMWGNREALDRHCPHREGKSLADLLAFGRERIATARRLMAANNEIV